MTHNQQEQSGNLAATATPVYGSVCVAHGGTALHQSFRMHREVRHKGTKRALLFLSIWGDRVQVHAYSRQSFAKACAIIADTWTAPVTEAR